MGFLYRIEELRALEARARAGLAPGALMQRAGRAAAAHLHTRLRQRVGTQRAGTVLLLCGPGDNGGDGFVCAAALRELGHDCRCWAPAASTRPDAVAARAHWQASGGEIHAQLPTQMKPDIVVDALFGIGAQRPLADPFLGALRAAQALGVPIVALDVPSGLHADTGAWIGAVAGVRAATTLTFLGDKPGLHMLDARDAAGTVEVHSLQTDALQAQAPPAGALIEPDQFGVLGQARAARSNKGDFGTVSVVGGAAGMVGAALLAARAALRLGAGKVIVDCIGAPGLAVDLLQPELMLRPGAAIAPGSTLVAGCGMGSDAAASERLVGLLAHEGPALFDADALNCIAATPQLQQRLAARSQTTVITPHPGEAARLLSCATPDVQTDRIASALRLARQTNAIVVLKGAGSVVAQPDGHYAVNPTGSAALASAGTGDVLAGMIGALLAQSAVGLPAAIAAVHAGVWLHGRAAELFAQDSGMSASEIAPLAARALAQLRCAGRPARLD